VDRAVVVEVDAAVLEQVPAPVQELLQRVRRQQRARLPPQALEVAAGVAAVADVVVAAVLLPNQLHDLQMEP
jgi:hypothetical protein